MSTAWPLSAGDLVTQALREAKVISSGEEPTADELADCIVRLNALLKTWGQGGGASWRQATTDVPVPANTATVALPNGTQEVAGVRVVRTGHERLLTRWERDEYQWMPNKATKGPPTAFVVGRSVVGTNLTLWPVSSTAITLRVDLIRGAETITNRADAVDIPQEYQEAVYMNLALRCADMSTLR